MHRTTTVPGLFSTSPKIASKIHNLFDLEKERWLVSFIEPSGSRKPGDSDINTIKSPDQFLSAEAYAMYLFQLLRKGDSIAIESLDNNGKPVYFQMHCTQHEPQKQTQTSNELDTYNGFTSNCSCSLIVAAEARNILKTFETLLEVSQTQQTSNVTTPTLNR